MPSSTMSEAATSSCVERGLLAQRTRSAPPALRVIARLAVSVVTCRQAEILMPLRGWVLANCSRINRRTGISLAAHSMRCLPRGARLRSLTSPDTLIGVVTPPYYLSQQILIFLRQQQCAVIFPSIVQEKNVRCLPFL